jgi:hypothetical protein
MTRSTKYIFRSSFPTNFHRVNQLSHTVMAHRTDSP